VRVAYIRHRSGGPAGAVRKADSRRSFFVLRLFAVLGLIAVLLCLAVRFPEAAQAKEWRIERMNVVLDVRPDSDVRVTETVTFRFSGQFNFVARVIPLVNLDGLLDIEVRKDGVELPPGSGPGTWAAFREAGYQVIQLNFSLADTSATWTIDYRATGAIHYLDDVDELRWYVLDADTPVPIDAIRAEVRLPGEISVDELSAAVRTRSEVEWRAFSPEPSVVIFEGRALPSFTEFWTVTSFPRGVVSYRWTPARIAAAAVPRLAFVLPLLTLLATLVVFLRRRSTQPSGTHAGYVASPPSELAPALVGVLLDQKVDRKEAAATLVDLARRGYVALKEGSGVVAQDTVATDVMRDTEGAAAEAAPVETLGGPSGAHSGLVVSKLQLFEDLESFEKALANGVAESISTGVGVEYDPASVQGAAGRAYAAFKSLVYDRALELGYFTRNPETSKNSWFGWGVILAIFGIVGSVVLWGMDIPGAGYLVLGSVVSGAILIGFGNVMPAYTHKGAVERGRWQAFSEYLKDLNRFEGVERADELYQSYLPYAVAFGLEREWARRFAGLTVPAGMAWFAPRDVDDEEHLRGARVHAYGEMGSQPTPFALDTATSGLVSPPVPNSAVGAGAGFSLDVLSDRLFKGLDDFSAALIAAPRSSGSESSSSSGVSSWSSYSAGDDTPSGGSGFSGGSGGGGFRAG